MSFLFGSSDVVPPERSKWRIDLESDSSSFGGSWGVDVGTGPSSLKVACLSDAHGHYHGMESGLRGADLVILAGDLLDIRQRDEASFIDMNNWISGLEQRKDQIIFVAGNHDRALCNVAGSPKSRSEVLTNATYLEGSMTTVANGNVTIAGGPWIMRRPIFGSLAQEFALTGSSLDAKWNQLVDLVMALRINKKPEEERERPGRFQERPERRPEKQLPPPVAGSTDGDPSFLDILVTHGPPEGVYDVDYKQRRTGTVSLRDNALAKLRPRVHVFGHNHDQAGVVWGNLRHLATGDSRYESDHDIFSDHRMLFVGAAATFTHVCQYFTLHY